MNSRHPKPQGQTQELHLFPLAWHPHPSAQSAHPPPLRLSPGPTRLHGPEPMPASADKRDAIALTEGAVLEPFLNAAAQLRLLVHFPEPSVGQVNGEPAPQRVVLAPGDFVQWQPEYAFRVALFSKPRIGPPPASALGKPCPNCRVPLAADSTCVTCACGAVLHCEPEEQGLQCAQMRRECPACKRPLLFNEGYVNPTADEA